MQCPQCRHENPDDARFCNACGTKLEATCPACAHLNPPGSRFCNACGHDLLAPRPTTDQLQYTHVQEREPSSYTPQYLAEKILTSRSALQGERKQVTVMFCDLASSTALAEHIGPDAMHTLLNRFFELALDDVHRYEGTINQFLGDGFMALFGAPVAHEDHARRGVLAALALQRTLQERHAELGEPYDVTCQFRIGLNSGIVVVGSIGDNLRMDYSAIGDTTNLAARLQGIAEPGEILVSEPTSRLVQGYIRLEALPPLHVKGKTDAVMPYRVTGTLPRRSSVVSRDERTLSTFVGREREIATLEALFAQIEAGQGQAVGIVAEAGSGKSRLLYEFHQRLADKQVTYLAGRCLSYGSAIPYHPLIDVLRNNCGIIETDGPEATTEKVRFALREVGMEPDGSTPYLLRLLGVKDGTEALAGLTPEAIRTKTFEILRQLGLQGSQQRPLIVEIEDLHWVDKTSEDFLASLVENLAGAPILLLTSYRPGYRPQWLDKSYATQIALPSLTPQDGLTVVHAALHGATLPEHLEQTIIEKAEGNPFFLEELTRTVVERGEAEADVDVPDTIQGVLSARIDRLPEEAKRLLQTASVLGRAFSPTVLGAIWEGSDAPEPLLLELKRLEFLYERTAAEEPIYIFKHALTQEVAYESLLTTRRQMLHAAAGRALERLYADRPEKAYDRLAYHYARTDDAAKAVEYLTLVADKAGQGYAYGERLASLQEALVHAERLPAEERDRCVLDLVIRQAICLYVLTRSQERLTLLLAYRGRLERLGDPRLAGEYYRLLGQVYAEQRNFKQARSNLQHALDKARQARDVTTIGRVYFNLAALSSNAGKYQQGILYGRQALFLLVQTADHGPLALLYRNLADLYTRYGDFARALEYSNQIAALGDAISDRVRQTYAALVAGEVYVLIGELEQGIEAFRQALECSPFLRESLCALIGLGNAYLEQGNLDRAVATLEQAEQQGQQYEGWRNLRNYKAFLGEAYLLDGQIEKARNLAHQVLEGATSSALDVGQAQRLQGRIARASDDFAEAERHLQDALATFSALPARYELARTYLDLASLANTQGNQDTAMTHLSTAYAWFKKLQVPKWVEQTEEVAHEYGVTLVEVELEALPEDEA